MQCHRHEDRQAERLCDACETPLCAECVLREQAGFDACSFSCADRLTRLAEEKKEAEELDPLPTRIWTSLFLVIFLTVVGGLAGGFLAFGLLGRRRGYQNNFVINNFEDVLKGFVIGGAVIGAASACIFLFRYYRRKL